MLVVSADAEALSHVIATADPAPLVVSAADAAEARIAASNADFHAIVVDLRNGDAAAALLVPQLADMGQRHIVVIAAQASAELVGGYAGFATIVMAPFSTATLLGKLKLDGQETANALLRWHKKKAAVTAPATGAVRVLFYPARPDGLFLPEGAVAVDSLSVRPDIVVLTEKAVARRFAASLPRPIAAIVPVIDISGGNGEIADIALNGPSQVAVADAILRLSPAVERARALPEDIFLTERDEDILLARLHVRERGIVPHYAPSDNDVVFTPDTHTVTNLNHTANALAASGALKKAFFDRINCCPSCDSARVLVREECRKCRSSDVEEVSIIHHFRCGYQAPERDYIEGNGLRCPKCMHTLDAFSVDYDRPGSLMVCNACDNETGEAAIGFKCMDCSANDDASKLVARTHHRYELTDAAARMLTNSFVNRAPSPTEAPAETPQAQVARFIRAMEGDKRGFSAMLVRLDRDGAMRREHGERAIRGSMHLVERALREAIAVDFETVHFESSLALLIPYGDTQALRGTLPEIVAHARNAIALPIDLAADAISGDRLKEIVFDPAKRRNG